MKKRLGFLLATGVMAFSVGAALGVGLNDNAQKQKWQKQQTQALVVIPYSLRHQTNGSLIPLHLSCSGIKMVTMLIQR